MSADFVVAVDLGGTWVKISSYDAHGPAAEVIRRTTERSAGAVSRPWLAGIVAEFADRRGRAHCLGFAVAVPGIVDRAAGVVRAAPNLGWSGVPLRDELVHLTGLPGEVGHDVRLGGSAERQLGAGVNCRDLMFLALGTGIAAALVVDGALLQADGYAGEIGHVSVPAANGLSCPCGRIGCLETVASAAGVSRTFARLAGRTLPAAEVADRARGGDGAARQAFAVATEALAEALDGAVTLLAPERIVLGGGLAGAYDLVAEPLAEQLERRLTFQRRPELRRAIFGADAGVVGAGLLGWQCFGALSV